MLSSVFPSSRPEALLVAILSLPLAACVSANDGGSSQATGAGETDAETNLTVTPEGTGVMMLRLETESPAPEDQLEGILISGPGGCLAVQPGGQPELLLFDQEASFADDPPRVSLGGPEVAVGEHFSVAATEVRVDDLQGVPEQCASGAADTAWVINSQ